MSAPAAILSKPTTTTSTTTSSSRYPFPIPTLKSLKIVSISQIPPSELLFHREFVSRKPISLHRGARSRNTMNGSTTNATSDSGFGGSSCGSAGDEGVSAFEQESLINHGSSSEFRPCFTAVGLESTLNRASKWLVTALFGAVLLWRHDGESLWAAMGSVVNVGLSTLLKQLLNQERPISTLRSDPGMPSSHAQSIFFIIIFAVVSLLQWLGANGLTITLSCLALAFASYLSWLRVSQHLHTISQVVVGAVIGSTFSILWFWSWDAIVLKAFISYLSVRIMVILGAAGFSVGFVVHVIRAQIHLEDQ